MPRYAISPVLRTFLTVLLLFAIVLIECAIGGTRLVFSLPSYSLLALAAVATVFSRPPGDSRPSLLCLGISAVFFGYILTRAMRSPVDYLWWTDFYMVLGCLTVYLLTAFYLTGVRERTIVIWTLFVLAALEVFIGLRQFAMGDNWMPFGFIRGGDSGRRASGTLISAIHLAGYLEAVAPFALGFALWGNWKTWKRVVAGYIALLCYVGIAITGSRGGYISAVFSLLVFVGISLHARRCTRPDRFRRTAFISLIAIAGSISVAVLLMNQSAMMKQRLGMISQQFEKDGLDIRIYNWQAALDQFQISPWFGTGAGTHLYYGRYFRRPQLQSDPIHAHSDYLELLAEYGVIGAAGMALFLIAHLHRGWRSYRQVLRDDLSDVGDWDSARNDRLALYIGALSAIAAYLAHSVVDFNLHIPGHALIFAFIFGVMASPVPGAADTGRSPFAVSLFRWALPALGLWILASGFPKFAGEYFAEKARVALRNYDFDESIRLAKEAVEYQDINPELYLTFGGAHRGAAFVADDQKERVAHLEAAVDIYQQSLAIFPQDEHMLIRLGQTFTDLGRFKEAEGMYSAAIVLDRNLAQIRAYLARHFSIVGREEEAEQYLQQARALSRGTNMEAVVRDSPLGRSTDEP